ncbi:MAG TPA: hypothetical protein VF808_10510 [Ktedonobacterales bacterium]
MSERNDDIEQVNEQDTQDATGDSDQETRLTLEAFYADAKQRIRYVIHGGSRGTRWWM